MDNDEKYELDCKKIKKENACLLKKFEKTLQSSGLSKKTIHNHLSNIHFYINEYLLYEGAIEAKDGINEVDNFLGYWFIKKTMWASKSTIKSNATSIKKFYTCLYENGLLEKHDINELKEGIKEGMPEWLTSLEGYDNQYLEQF